MSLSYNFQLQNIKKNIIFSLLFFFLFQPLNFGNQINDSYVIQKFHFKAKNPIRNIYIYHFFFYLNSHLSTILNTRTRTRTRIGNFSFISIHASLNSLILEKWNGINSSHNFRTCQQDALPQIDTSPAEE